MSSACVDLLLYEINNSFGSECRTICHTLLYNEWTTFKEIKQELKGIKSNKILEYLQILINFNIVSFNLEGDTIESYQFDIEGGLAFLRLDKYLYLIESQHGNLSKLVFEEFCARGNLYFTQLCEIVKKHFNSCDNWIKEVVDITNSLIKMQILQVTPMYLIKHPHSNRFPFISNFDDIIEHFSNQTEAKAGRKRAYDELKDEIKEWDVQYGINHIRMNVFCLNEIFVKDAAVKNGEDAGFVMQKFVDTFQYGSRDCHEDPISKSLLFKKVRSDEKDFDEDKFEDCIYLLAENDGRSASYMELISNINGILFRFDSSKLITDLVVNDLSDMVEVVYGRQGVQMFQFLLKNPFIEESLFKKSVYISPERINWLLPKMITDGFVTKLEMSKTKQYYDEPLVSVLRIDLNKLVRDQQRHCHECLYRLMVRRNHEEVKNKPLLTKMYEMSLKDQSFQTVDGDGAIAVITELDKEMVRKLNKGLNKLDEAEMAIHKSLFLFDAFIEYASASQEL